MTILCSCKFSKPILAIPHSKYVKIDSTTNNKVKTKYFKYLSFRNGISIGGGSVEKIYNTDGKIIEKQISKSTHFGLKDGNNRYYLKEITYDSLNHVSKIHYKIRQNYGRAATTVYEKTIDKTKK
jgi:hypothetical protein